MTPAALPPSALDKLSFLAGHWRGESGATVIEEVWLPPLAGVAEGMVRLVRDGAIGTLELLLASAERNRVMLRYNHFHPDYRTWEADGPIELTLTTAEDGRIVFSNLGDPPRHALEMGYEKTRDGGMTSWVVAIGANGARTRHSFDFKRMT